MDNNLKIKMLGEFSISYNDNTLNDSTSRFKKVWSLLEYLITFREKEISQNELIEVLWEDENLSSPTNNLKTLVHRARNVLDSLGYTEGKNMIKFSRGSYHWNNDLDFEIDIEIFKNLIDKAKFSDNKDEKLEYYFKAIDVYKGTFLPKSAYESWAVPVATYYQNMYITMINDMINILKEKNDYQSISEICEKAVIIDPYDEDLHYHLIYALAKNEKNKEALEHYEYVVDLFYKQFGLNLSDKLTSLYKTILDTTKNVELDLNIIKENLKEKTYSKGAFYCELGLFKELCQIEARSIARTGVSINLALFTIININGAPIKQHIMNKYMDKLHSSIQESLRRGDVFTRYSLCQYIVMLPSTSFENADMVSGRIARDFKKKIAKPDLDIKFTISPLEPNN
ncbi:AfsR/SARP family transcriptional regulator [Anaerofustis stercorihominis]|uniref:AfsR/SARP family transcriptional regulator n=1 Tax=Anaerofustis stercorihominis TaxID=214853 RepID=UPI002673C13E|nr:BTAD domain-containing putative transcriptional regulator [Anaerofustis stercorihominis]